MPAIVPRFGIGTIDYSIKSGTYTDLDVSTFFSTEEYQSNVWKRVIIYSTVVIGTTNTTGYALTIPSGFGGRIYILNRGSIYGAGGVGGTSSSQNGTNGGSAIFAGASNIYIDNRGIIYAGGGGGGAGTPGTSGGTASYSYQGGAVQISLSATVGTSTGGNGRGYLQNQTNGSTTTSGSSVTFSSNGWGNGTLQFPPNCAVNITNTNAGTVAMRFGSGSNIFARQISSGINDVYVSGTNSTVVFSQTSSGLSRLHLAPGQSFSAVANQVIYDSPAETPANQVSLSGNWGSLNTSMPGFTDPGTAGNGGDWGQSGQDATPGGTGGLAGYYVFNSGNVTFLNLGTVAGRT